MTKNTNPLISVIIPVYNAEQYLPNCLNSILRQYHQNFEIIIVDDGSTDNSSTICDKYAQKDSRIQVIHKKNEGVSVARNTALSISKGEYIAFIDADDDISADFLSIPKELQQTDVIQKSYKCIRPNGIVSETKIHNRLLTKWDAIAFLWVNKPNRALWDKIISRKIIGSNLFIPGVAISEDFLFFTTILPNIKTYALCDTGHYNYYIRKNSAMSAFQRDPHERVRITLEHIKIIETLGEREKKMHYVCKGLIYELFMYSLWNARSLLLKEEYITFTRLLKQMTFSDLRYLNSKWKIKMYLIKLKNTLYKHG